MYLCEGQRLKKYKKERELEETNDERQQAAVDALNAERLGLDLQSESLSKLAKGVFSSLTKTSVPVITQNSITQLTPMQQAVSIGTSLIDIIKSRKLTELFDKVKSIPDKKLSRKARIVKQDITSNKDVKDTLNDIISGILAENLPADDEAKKIEQSVIDIAAGGDQKVIEELTSKANDQSLPMKTSVNDSPLLFAMNDILKSYTDQYKGNENDKNIYRDALINNIKITTKSKNITQSVVKGLSKNELETALKLLPPAQKRIVADYAKKQGIDTTSSLKKDTLVNLLNASNFNKLVGLDDKSAIINAPRINAPLGNSSNYNKLVGLDDKSDIINAPRINVPLGNAPR